MNGSGSWCSVPNGKYHLGLNEPNLTNFHSIQCNIFSHVFWPPFWPSWLSQDLASKTHLLLEHSLALWVMAHIVAVLIKNRNSRHLSAIAQNIPVVFFMSIKSCWFFFLSAGFNNGSFLARHAVSRQSTLLGPTAGCAVLIINFADECRLFSPLIYFSLVYMHMYIPVCTSLCCCCCYIYACM